MTNILGSVIGVTELFISINIGRISKSDPVAVNLNFFNRCDPVPQMRQVEKIYIKTM